MNCFLQSIICACLKYTYTCFLPHVRVIPLFGFWFLKLGQADPHNKHSVTWHHELVIIQLKSETILFFLNQFSIMFWAATWQNQQNECAPREDSDQPGHLPSLIRAFAVRMKKAWVLNYPLSGCPGWSEASLSAQSLCWFCHVVALLYFKTIIFQYKSVI